MKHRLRIADEAQAEACRRAGLLAPSIDWQTFAVDIRELETYQVWAAVDAGLLPQSQAEQELRRRRRGQHRQRWRT